MLMTADVKRRLRLRQLTNDSLFPLYDNELLLRLHNPKNLRDTRRMLGLFKEYLNGFPPSPEIAKGFLAQYSNKKPRTLYRYSQMILMFMKWYGEPIEDFKVRIPKTLPDYTEDKDIEKLFQAIENKRSHKGCIVRDTLIVELALKTGMRRSELANLIKKDIHSDFLVVRNGKGGKDRVIPLIPSVAERLRNFTSNMLPEDNVFQLKPACISNKIKQFAKKAGLTNFHTHSMRHKFATDLLERGADIRCVQEILGHENLNTTQVYLSITGKRIREAVSLLEKEGISPEFIKELQPVINTFMLANTVRSLLGSS